MRTIKHELIDNYFILCIKKDGIEPKLEHLRLLIQQRFMKKLHLYVSFNFQIQFEFNEGILSS